MTRYIIANWKMNFTLQDAIEFCERLPYSNLSLIIAAPTAYLSYLVQKFPKISFSGQDVSAHETYGARTGEVSAKMLASCGVKYCIVGHPERRRDYGESDEIVIQKADNCILAGIKPIICLGGDLSLRPSIDGDFMLAYEPIEAIGTGVLPGQDELSRVFRDLKNQVAKSVNLVYGGSVNSGNLATIKSIKAIDSILLGGASLRVDELIKILEDW